MIKNRYAFLDGIRGLVAIIVVTRHTDEYWTFSIFRSYLAVDIFFILSGFVIAYAYERKLIEGSMSISEFLKTRIIRLYPVFFLSLLIASLTFLVKNEISTKSGFHLALIALPTLFFLPGGFFLPGALFPINTPYWSLYYELITNTLYAFIRPYLNNFIIISILVITGSVIMITAIACGNINAGFNAKISSMIVGFSRSLFGFFVGYVLYKNKFEFLLKISRYISPWVATLILVLALLIPSIGKLDGVIDIILVSILFPICIFIASQASSSKFDVALFTLGSISYPIYLLHKPVSELIAHELNTKIFLYIPLTGVLLVIGLSVLAILIEKFFDIPLRKLLSKKFN